MRVALADYSEAQVVEAATAAGEPHWLIEQRTVAWRHFAASVPPFWRRTDLSQFHPEQIEPATDSSATTLTWDAAAAPAGVVFCTLADAVRHHPQLVERYLGTVVDPLAHKFAALNAALWQNGFFLYVPKHVAVEIPLTATLTLHETNQAVVAHNLIILEEGASATLVEAYTSESIDGQAFASPVSEIVLGAGSMLRYITAQTWGDGVYHIGAQRALVGRDATIEWAAISIGSRVQHVEAETALAGDGSRVDWVAATFAAGNQTLLTAPWLRHIGAKTDAHMDFKTVVKDASYAVFDGMIRIEHASRATSSRLEEHALHLTPKARSDSIPGLMIDTNDVLKAGHASTSGEVDEEMLFYMRSRGIRREDAMRLIVMGFFEPVLDRIPTETLREHVTALIDARLG
ncbi:MAG TPA: Fe-S cluster assembly protein SufD [Roseiflexaceae bacterium]|nr:Fe-S cluster assembly protein SufD [Roseiflexaceae bacterium]HMP43318.1 Fe-S cluster assembly protein SufD [Roseiflexaceae bacterium]